MKCSRQQDGECYHEFVIKYSIGGDNTGISRKNQAQVLLITTT